MKVARLATTLCLAASMIALPAGAAFAAGKSSLAKRATVSRAPAARQIVEPDALAAMTRMSTYLRTLDAFQVRSDTVREEVMDNDQKLQFLGSVTYKAKRPNGFNIEIVEDRRVRQIFYDGTSLTMFAPRMNYYATVSAPPTIRETLQFAADKYGVSVPLRDLFIWGTDEDWHADLQSGYWVGYARISGQDADQYAFREKGVDWQIWIARGDKPLPLRVALTGTGDPARPQFESTLTWDVAPQFAADAFKFTPPADAKAITFATASH
jgi:hypothetical protein